MKNEDGSETFMIPAETLPRFFYDCADALGIGAGELLQNWIDDTWRDGKLETALYDPVAMARMRITTNAYMQKRLSDRLREVEAMADASVLREKVIYCLDCLADEMEHLKREQISLH